MWREYDDQGFLVNSFVETVSAIHPEYVMRVGGGLLYLAGALIMVYNIWRTIQGRCASGKGNGWHRSCRLCVGLRG